MRSPLLILPTLAAAGALLGCGPPPDASRLLLMDEAARVAGATVQLDHWEGSPAFAVRLMPDERPLLVTPGDARRLEIPAHMMAYVEGADAQVRLLDLDHDVARDALVLTGSEGAARQVARMLDAEVASVEGGRVQLSGPDLLDRSAFLEAPRGLREVRPLEHAPAELQSLFSRRPTAAIPVGEMATDPLLMAGVYASDNAVLVLDAEGGFTLQRGCSDAVRGTAYAGEDGLRLISDHGRPELVQVLEGGALDLGGEPLKLFTEEAP
ncbi:MAG TPA: hypothetical protein VND93_26365 [Myxococcales bacterium]|nr:hypothetical protein [Myxococcales bacterium]